MWASGPGEGHVAAVRRLAWRPQGEGAGEGEGEGERDRGGGVLASCGEDHAVRVFGVGL